MKYPFANPWASLSLDAWSLSLEAANVIGMRMMKIAAGGAAGWTESQLMVSEKVEAGLALQVMALTGGLGSTGPVAARRTLKHYGRKVRANRRRLSRG